MAAEIRIRKAKENELGLVRRLTIEELPSELNDDELKHVGRIKEVFDERIDALFSKEGNEIFVAEIGEGGTVAGYVWFGVSQRPFSGLEVGWIYDIQVLPEHRGKGVGEALMRHAMKVSRERGFNQIGLMVNAKNRVAASLYEKLGFRTEYRMMEKSEQASVSASKT